MLRVITKNFQLLSVILAVLVSIEASSISAAPGDLDPTFGAGGKVQTAVGTEDRGNAMVLQPDGKIVVCGRSRPGAVRFDFALARYNADGTLDAGFGSGGTVITSLNAPFGPDDECLAVAIQPDGKIIAVGSQRSTGGALINTGIIRYNPNGTLDTTFGTGGILIIERSVELAVIIQPDGKIVVGGGGGESSQANYQITRLNQNGTRDTSFGTGGDVTIDFAGSGDGVWGLALQPDGKIIAAGRSRILGGNDNFAVVRLNPNGSLDQTFGTGGKTVADFANDADFGFAVALQTDGKVIVSGQARLGGNNLEFGLVRFNADGSLDTSFGNAGRVTTDFRGGSDVAYAVKVQSNGKIVAAGVSGGTTSVFGVARYNPNGSLDATFGSGGKTETFFNGIDQARALQIQPDGKLVVAGTARGGAIIGNFALARYIGDDSGLPTPTPTPTPTGIVSGKITYANAPTTTFVPFTTITADGSIPLSTLTDINGFYSLSGFGAGVYNVTPSKAGQVNGISNLDASTVARHIVGLVELSDNQFTAADTSGNGAVSALDAAYIAQYVASIDSPSITGTWRFTPATRSYFDVQSSQTNQDYSAILVGDVTGNWNPSGALRPESGVVENGSRQQKENTGQMVGVSVRGNLTAAEGSGLTLNLTTGNLTGKGVLGYQFELLYNSKVIEPQTVSCDVSDTISRRMTVICHASEPGVLKVVVFGATPVSGEGTLLKLNFKEIGARGSTSGLSIRNFMFNEDKPVAEIAIGR